MNIFEPSLAAMVSLRGLIVIAAMVFIFLAVVAGIVALIIFLMKKNPSGPARPPVIPRNPDKTEVIRTCPKCGSTLRADLPEGLCPACLLQHGIATEAGPADPAAFTPPTQEEIAKLFPQLEIISLIGKGGMGAVYKARQPALDRLVALKILAPKPGNELDFGTRFSREAKALARLNHPGIVTLFEFGSVVQPEQKGGKGEDEKGDRTEISSAPQPLFPSAPLYYFLMEYVDGPNLRQIQQSGRLTPREALEIIPQICAALQFAHDEGIVHRDIKPENVLIDRKGRVKIADFGLAKILGQEPKDFRLTGVRDVMGTPHYMAPEQVEKPQEVDHRADIYSLGVVFYEMLTGELPIGKFPLPSQKVQVDVRLDEVVLRALEKEPEKRYQQASELRTRVETVASSGAESSSKPINPSPNHGKISLLSLAALALFALGILGTLFLMSISPRHGTALVFGLVAIVASLTCAALSWREKTSRILAFSTAGMVVLGFAVFGFNQLIIHPVMERKAQSEMRRRQEQLTRRLEEFMAQQRRASELKTDSKIAVGANLLAIEYQANKVRHFWNPDGSTVEESVSTLLEQASLKPRKNEYVLSLLVTNGLDDFLLTQWMASVGRNDLGRLGQVLPVPELNGTLIRIRFPNYFGRAADSVEERDVRFAVPIHPWRTVRSWEGPGFRLNNDHLEFAGLSRYIDLRSFSNQAVLHFDHQTGDFLRKGTVGTEITLDLPEKSLSSHRWALEIETVGGTTNLVSLFSAVPNQADVWTGTAVWNVDIRREQIRRITLKGLFPEDYHWTEFRDVVFKPFPPEPVVSTVPEPVNTPSAFAPRREPPSLLEFRWALNSSQTNESADEFPDPHDRSRKSKIRLERDVVLNETAIVGASAQTIGEDLSRVIVVLSEEGQRRLLTATSNNVHRRLAIVWNGSVLSAPIVQSAIPGPSLQIAGNFSKVKSENLAAALNHSCGNTDPATPPAFGQVVYRTLFARKNPERVAFDFDSGKTFTVSDRSLTNPQRLQEWLNHSVADVILDVSPKVRGFITAGQQSVRVPDSDWTNASANRIEELLMSFRKGTSIQPREPAAIGVNSISTGQSQSRTFAFETQEDGFGLLQLLDVSDGEDGYVHFRYKLLGKIEPPPTVFVQPLEISRRNIDYLVRNATVQTGYKFEIWDSRGGTEPRLRHDVIRIPLALTSGSTSARPMQGEIFWLKNAGRFYLQWDAIGSINHHYYGPFMGEPASILSQAAPSPEAVARDLTARLDAAKQIMGFPERDGALAAIAQDAAIEGNVLLVRRILNQITAFTSRDDATCKAVRILAANGQRTEALEIARTITAFPTRDEMLRELTK